MDDLLRQYGISPEDNPLGEGVEAVVYPYGDDKVIRVYKKSDKTVLEAITKAKRFYDDLDDSRVSFKVPKILSVHNDKDITYSIDERLQGIELSVVFETLSTSEKSKILHDYIQAAEQVCTLTEPYGYYGEVLSSDPIRTFSWTDFLSIKLQTSYEKGRRVVEQEFPGYKATVDNLNDQLGLVSGVKRAQLVHGDYYVGNVLVSDEVVSAVIDFNNLTLAGDPRMDIASAIIFLGDGGTGKRDSERLALIDGLAKKQGETIREIIHFYKMYYAVIFAASAKDSDPATYRWAITAMGEHVSGVWKY